MLCRGTVNPPVLRHCDGFVLVFHGTNTSSRGSSLRRTFAPTNPSWRRRHGCFRSCRRDCDLIATTLASHPLHGTSRSVLDLWIFIVSFLFSIIVGILYIVLILKEIPGTVYIGVLQPIWIDHCYFRRIYISAIGIVCISGSICDGSLFELRPRVSESVYQMVQPRLRWSFYGFGALFQTLVDGIPMCLHMESYVFRVRYRKPD